ncbi:MAG TPA: GNAT family N-acetyltransferase [Planctomycetaceae bacterium]|jgi:ribosomal protein S18 acetylase RimI-like enzyme|nr:GNAT family N-acetyltransferase [Planctomycetaceae bacterium]
MGSSVTIREAAANDRPALEACMAELQAFECTIERNRVAPETIRGVYIDYLLSECQKSDGTILVAEANGQVVGFVCVLCRVDSEEIVEIDRLHAYITDLVVLEPHRNAGIGSQLIQAAESQAQARGATRIEIGVLTANSAAHRLYQKLGYCDREVVLEKRLESADGR